ncbi:MgtC/SapB family protein [Patescibacteria group bacterium]
MDFSIFQQLGAATVLASLIGIERERRQQLFKYQTAFGGLRTYVLAGITGALAFIMADISSAFFLLITGGFLSLLLASYVLTTRKYTEAGATSEIAAILVYMIGVICAMDQYVLATTIALTVLIILHFKKPLHHWVRGIQNEEIYSTIQFAIIAFIILPLLPNQGLGPYEFFNPYMVWLMVVFISGLSFLSYIAIRIFGAKRGILLTGFLGGLASSTALTLSFSEESKKNKNIMDPYVISVVIAGSAMFFRVLVMIAILNYDLFKILWIPIFCMGFVGISICIYLLLKLRKKPKDPVDKKIISKVKSPFNLVPALKFGLFFAFILFVSKLALEFWGDQGLYLTSVFSGIFDVDAIALSVLGLFDGGLSGFVAVLAITIGAMVNTLSKGVMFYLFGNKKVAKKILKIYLLILIVGGLSLFFI